jgi:hypothetical protein
MLIMRGMGAEDRDAPMVPSWAVDKPEVTITTGPTGKKTYVFDEPIVIEGKLPGKAKATSWWPWILGAIGLAGAGYWYYQTQYRKGRSRPKGRFASRAYA